MTLAYDAQADVIYVRSEGARSVTSNEAPSDGHLILSTDASEAVVGTTLMAASEMPADFWCTHPDRGLVPTDLLAAMDAWIGGDR